MIPLFTTEQNRNADNYAIEQLKIPGIVLMENAALSVFNSIKQNFNLIEGISQIGILVGKGNNGGDGIAVARHFINNGFLVNILLLYDYSQLKGDAKISFEILQELINQTDRGKIWQFDGIKSLRKIEKSSLIIDAILGTGSNGILVEPLKSIIQKVNQFESIRVAIDIPTGINADTGFGETIFNADLTISLGEFKQGLFIQDGKLNSGKIEKGYIGIGDEYFSSLEANIYLIEPEDAAFALPKRKQNLHKYSAGKVFTIAGSEKYTGAAYFSGNSPFFVGIGAAFLAIPKKIRTQIQDEKTGIIYLSYGENEYLTERDLPCLEEKLNWANVISLGSGLGREVETQAAILKILVKSAGKRVVIDADGLFPLNKNYQKYDLSNFILTPHHKEFSELIGISLEELQKDVLSYGSGFTKETQSYLVLKGSPTIIFQPNGEVFVNTTGNSGMAKFGMGDVLTGVIAGLVPQTNEISQAIISAVYLHSLSADLLALDKTEFGFTANDVMQNLPKTIKFLNESIL